MATDTVQQIKDRLSIVDVVGSYVKLTKAGASYKARCPFHSERTPSFTVSPSRGTYHCFGCGVGGDLFSFVQEAEGLDFKGALKVLAERAGVQLVYEKGSASKDEREALFAIMESAARFYEETLTKYPPVLEYLKGRGITEKTTASFRLGFVPNEWRQLTTHLRSEGYSEADIENAGLGKRTEKGIYDRFRSRIMFPIMDSAGRVVAFSGRHFEQEGSPAQAGQEPPKYVNSPETLLFHKSRILYGFDRAKLSIRKYDCTVLVEGQIDLVMAHQAGWTNAVAASGTAFTEGHVALVHRLSDNLILALDADAAGIRAAAKSARIALAAGMDVKVAELPEGMDPAELIQTQGAEAWNKAMKDARHVIVFLLDILERTQKDARSFARAVEKAVLPFVAAIKSPIDRAHFVREVAARIDMPEPAVREALSRAEAEEPLSVRDTAVAPDPHPVGAMPFGNPRERQLIGLLLWQQSLKKPGMDVAQLEEKMREALRREAVIPEVLSEAERESLRFGAEGLYGESESLVDDADALLQSVRIEQLRVELQEASGILRKAERAGDEAAVGDALRVCQLLTREIAKLDKLR